MNQTGANEQPNEYLPDEGESCKADPTYVPTLDDEERGANGCDLTIEDARAARERFGLSMKDQGFHTWDVDFVVPNTPPRRARIEAKRMRLLDNGTLVFFRGGISVGFAPGCWRFFARDADSEFTGNFHC